MSLKKEVLRSRCKRPLHLTKFLCLSGLEIERIDRLGKCENLHWLIASDNKLQSDDGLKHLRQLWYLDLSNNQITYILCLPRFLALGTLILSNNNIKWSDIEKIRHAHFLSISLHGNPLLDSDPYYRIHVIDCLPLIWELDGRLVTVTERLQVKQFFIDSELSPHPVRHKLGKSFVTSSIKNIGTEGIVSKECKYIFSKFPMSEKHTKHTDERRLHYLAHMVQEDIHRMGKELGNAVRPALTGSFLHKLLDQRKKDVERCNMVMLLLVISLEFQLPTMLMRSVLNTARLDMIGSVKIMPFFLLPPIYRTRVISILLNAAKVDRDNNVRQAGGLYPELFMCLYYTVAQLTRVSQSSPDNLHKIKSIYLKSDYMSLMASEVVSLMLQVPRYFTYLSTDEGVINLTVSALGNFEVIAKSQEILEEAENVFNNIPIKSAHKEVSVMILNAIQERLGKIDIKMADIPVADRYLALSDSLPIKPLHSVIWASQFLTQGQAVPRLDPPILNPVRERAKPKSQLPKLGDLVLLGPQVVGEINMLLQGGIGMVKMDSIPVANGAIVSKLKSSDPHYTFVDLDALCYARDIAMWRPIKTIGDNSGETLVEERYTIHSTETSQLVSTVNEKESPPPVIYTPSTKTKVDYSKETHKEKSRPQSSYIKGSPKVYGIIRKSMSAALHNRSKHNVHSLLQELDIDQAFLEADDSADEDVYSSYSKKPLSTTSSDSSYHVKDPIPGTDKSRHAIVSHQTSQSSSRGVILERTTPDSSRSSSPVPTTTEQQASNNVQLQVVQSSGHVASQNKSCLLTSQKDRLELCRIQESSQDNMSSLGPVYLSQAQRTFITSVASQSEGLRTVKQQMHLKQPDRGEIIDLTFQDNAEAPNQSKRSQTSMTVGRRVRNQKRPPVRSQSVGDALQYITITHLPFAGSFSARLDSNSVFKKDVQCQHKETWRQTTENRKSRPLTASASLQLPSFHHVSYQSPGSPKGISGSSGKPGLKITPTDKWLGDGKDIYWEAVSQRPKSGHMPGWKEGLPESMKKKRSKSAHVTSLKTQNMSQHSPSSLLVSSCSNYNNLDSCYPGYSITSGPEDLDVTYMMPHSYPLLQQHHYPPLSSPVSDHGCDLLPVLAQDRVQK